MRASVNRLVRQPLACRRQAMTKTQDGRQGYAPPAGSAMTDTDLLNWIEDNPRENLEAIDFKIRNGQSDTVRDAIRFHTERGL